MEYGYPQYPNYIIQPIPVTVPKQPRRRRIPSSASLSMLVASSSSSSMPVALSSSMQPAVASSSKQPAVASSSPFDYPILLLSDIPELSSPVHKFHPGDPVNVETTVR
uniref:Uncharacterized protein n=1 Tax=Schizaphis graminum TaxID=13262 RepID=A0A2S2NWD3_SCHGA